MREERARLGVHYEAINTELSANEQRQVLRGLSQANLLGFLQRHPIKRIYMAPIGQVHRDEFTTGRYIFDSRRPDYEWVYIASNRPASTWNQPLDEAYSLSAAAPNRIEAMKRTLVHEAGHHVLQVHELAIRALITAAIDSRNARPLTPYATTLPDEYFAECFAAYVFHPRVLQQADPVGYNMVVATRVLAGIPL